MPSGEARHVRAAGRAPHAVAARDGARESRSPDAARRTPEPTARTRERTARTPDRPAPALPHS
ncbi:hypothetical protein OG233_05535 [Streptomyces sp. NBC_01218]|uniref:hypothetical protein n=1 Tax=unclassified Streptomyces TaxID=2593676 RepID=UPI0023B9187F|nr:MULTISPECIES: hypothetical protein [unclassified Streptomyces]WEH39017.1 hypothetical protein PZB77_05545 [Streptomyces sp. AM 2-1-1]WSQ50676.1 hypothetical protein OG233_05535 [Streptomyces sp. NBC_01218]